MFLTKEMRSKLRWQKFGQFIQAVALACGAVAYFALLLLLSN